MIQPPLDIVKKTMQRDSNIELLRIVLIIMIIVHHFIVHGCNFSSLAAGMYEKTANDYMYLFTLSFVGMAVNCFVFISGYYGIKFKLKTLFSIVVQALFYTISIYIIFAAFFLYEGFINYPQILLTNLFPISNVYWWFLTAYIALFIMSPILNKGVDMLTKKQLSILILLLLYLEITYIITGNQFLSGNGESIYTFVVIYIIGRFCQKYITEIKGEKLLYLLTSSLMFICILTLYKLGEQKAVWRFFGHNSLFNILGAVFLFYIFKKIKVGHSPFINKISVLTLGVYLIHDSGYVRNFLSYHPVHYLRQRLDSPVFFLIELALLAIIVFIVCAAIEKLRQLIFNPIVERIYTFAQKYIPKF